MKANASPQAFLDSTRIAKATSWCRSMEYGLLFSSDVVLQRLAEDLEHMAAARRRLVGAEDGAVGE
jgi:hypothetical protein